MKSRSKRIPAAALGLPAPVPQAPWVLPALPPPNIGEQQLGFGRYCGEESRPCRRSESWIRIQAPPHSGCRTPTPLHPSPQNREEGGPLGEHWKGDVAISQLVQGCFSRSAGNRAPKCWQSRERPWLRHWPWEVTAGFSRPLGTVHSKVLRALRSIQLSV